MAAIVRQAALLEEMRFLNATDKRFFTLDKKRGVVVKITCSLGDGNGGQENSPKDRSIYVAKVIWTIE